MPENLSPLVNDLVFVGVVLVILLLTLPACGRIVRLIGKKVELPPLALSPLASALRFLILLLAASALIGHFFAVDVLTVLGGLLGLVAIGFVAVWSTLSNVLCTFLLLLTRPFRIGDEVELVPDPIRGEVVDLTFFFTTLKDAEGRYFRIPNNLFFQRIIRRTPGRRPPVTLGEQLGRDLDAEEGLTAGTAATPATGSKS